MSLEYFRDVPGILRVPKKFVQKKLVLVFGP